VKQYLDAVREVLTTGTRKENRTDVDTISAFNLNYSIDLQRGFPLLTTKKIDWKNIVVEMLWFLSGQTHIGVLKKHGCKFWDAWADKETGEVPSAYGSFWRKFPVHTMRPDDSMKTLVENHERSDLFNDQLAWVVNTLKRDPMSRRMVVSAWAPGNAQTSKLPPCHCQWIVNVQNYVPPCQACPYYNGSGIGPGRCTTCNDTGLRHDLAYQRLCLHLTQRSADMALGVPYNIASYALLMHLLSRFSGIRVGTFGHALVDAHVYTSKPDGSMAEYDHVPGLREQLQRAPRRSPWLRIDSSVTSLDDVPRLLELGTEELMKLFVLEGYDPHPAINFKVAV
jgi:thymidylate synthase